MFAVKQSPSTVLSFLVARTRWDAYHHIVSRVVQTCKNTTHPNKKRSPRPGDIHAMISHKRHPPYHKMECQHVIEFPQEKLKRMNVHGINVCTGGCLLVVVVFVHKGIYCFHMKEPVKERVEKVVGDEEYWDWKDGIHKRQIYQLPHPHPTAAAMVVSVERVFFVLVVMVMFMAVSVSMIMMVIIFMDHFLLNTP
jgi:hypothetical protein